MISDDDNALASFEAKWGANHPELALALGFVPAAERAAQGAFACLVFELEHAAFVTRDAEPAAAKLQWWAAEFVRAAEGKAGHPLTRALAAHANFAQVEAGHWYEVVRGALMQREPDPAPDAAALLDGYATLYQPLGKAEAILFGVDAPARGRALALSRALREVATLTDSLRAGRLPLPLDRLARHRLARGDLAAPSPARRAALQDWLRTLIDDFASLPLARLGAVGAALASADRRRARRAMRADEPLSALGESLGRLPLATVWAAWRAGRRSPR